MAIGLDNPVPWYLTACYAYEHLDESVMSDNDFDVLGQYIQDNWDSIQHRHKHLIDREGCPHTSAITKPYHQWPLIILNAAHQMTKEPKGRVWRLALRRFEAIDDLL